MYSGIEKKLSRVLIVLSLCLMTLISGCQSKGVVKSEDSGAYHYDIVGTAIAVDFGPDGRLWRLIPTTDAVYVDFSTDQGQSYSKPVKVNREDQKINAWSENPPAIKVSKSGRIHVLYYADADQKATTYYSYSDDGISFSMPVTVSDHAQSAMHYMDQMLVDDQDQVYMFWHDTRHGMHDDKLGSGVLSLYYTVSAKDSNTFVNHKLTDAVCSCCRTATDLAPNGRPVILARMVFSGGVRDHALIRMQNDGQWSKAQRVLRDQWQIDACPEHGPALSIGQQERAHLAWFTLGPTRKGIYYAYSDDYGKSLSSPISLGNKKKLPSHPDVMAVGDRVVLAWQEFDGSETSVVIKQSNDRGATWSMDTQVLNARGKTGFPDLVKQGEAVYLSWLTKNEGHKFIRIQK